LQSYQRDGSFLYAKSSSKLRRIHICDKLFFLINPRTSRQFIVARQFVEKNGENTATAISAANKKALRRGLFKRVTRDD